MVCSSRTADKYSNPDALEPPLVLNYHDDATTGPVHWQQRRAQQVLVVLSQLSRWSAGYNWDHAPSQVFKAPLWQRSSQVAFLHQSPVPGLIWSCHVRIDHIRYGGAHRWSDENHHRLRSVLAVQWRKPPADTAWQTDTNKTENQNHWVLPKEKPLFFFLLRCTECFKPR